MSMNSLSTSAAYRTAYAHFRGGGASSSGPLSMGATAAQGAQGLAETSLGTAAAGARGLADAQAHAAAQNPAGAYRLVQAQAYAAAQNPPAHGATALVAAHAASELASVDARAKRAAEEAARRVKIQAQAQGITDLASVEAQARIGAEQAARLVKMQAEASIAAVRYGCGTSLCDRYLDATNSGSTAPRYGSATGMDGMLDQVRGHYGFVPVPPGGITPLISGQWLAAVEEPLSRAFDKALAMGAIDFSQMERLRALRAAVFEM